ncbi:MAG: TRAP transporter substrate-binding protein [Proteobacteria bacterium]|nr:TRAP transporter substrate-binding protein [Pseudomonadota bacterium]MBU1386282.1 TRAP transporter substrate-binding protein [Pseudomonadota bacterium]MBU1542974.1 TRAP transporter substrate-binding protein [Pseudomonadota bacterium]MBU2479997.1 TRAP transporter substrate-binding protein [Pseudomonadota bacterium]
MKKKMLLSMLIVFSVSIRFFSFDAFAEEQAMVLATWVPAKHYVSVQQTAWVAEVNAALVGKVKIIEYPGGQLYGPKDMHMAVAKGSVPMGQILQTSLVATVPMLKGVYLPFAFENLDQVAQAYSGESLAIIEKAMEKKNIKLVYISFIDGAHIFSTKKHIATVSDFKGLRVLTTSPIVSEIFAKLGAAPDPSIPQTEQYLALKRGVSDGVAQCSVSGFLQKTYEAAPYITQMDMSFPTILTCMNLNKWNELPKEYQEIMLNAGKKASATTLATVKGWESKFTEDMIALGAKVIRMAPEERAKLKETSKFVYEKWAGENGPDAQRLLEINSKL